MPKVKKVKKPIVNQDDYSDYGEFLAAKKAAEAKKENKNES